MVSYAKIQNPKLSRLNSGIGESKIFEVPSQTRQQTTTLPIDQTARGRNWVLVQTNNAVGYQPFSCTCGWQPRPHKGVAAAPLRFGRVSGRDHCQGKPSCVEQSDAARLAHGRIGRPNHCVLPKGSVLTTPAQSRWHKHLGGRPSTCGQYARTMHRSIL
jgi:hypothetical protein